MKYIYAGDRDISVWVLEFLLSKGYHPSALLLTEESKATHAEELKRLADLPDELVFQGKGFASPETLKLFSEIAPDYIIGIHFPYIIRTEVLTIPKVGMINLHPAFLPYNRGWHTPSWAILEGTPAGATLHFMAEDVDAGDIIHQEKLNIDQNDTANELYHKLKRLELKVFKDALPDLLSLKPNRKVQDLSEGTSHRKSELFKSEIMELDLKESYELEDLLTRLRALTTSTSDEAAYFKKNGITYRVQVKITREDE